MHSMRGGFLLVSGTGLRRASIGIVRITPASLLCNRGYCEGDISYNLVDLLRSELLDLLGPLSSTIDIHEAVDNVVTRLCLELRAQREWHLDHVFLFQISGPSCALTSRVLITTTS